MRIMSHNYARSLWTVNKHFNITKSLCHCAWGIMYLCVQFTTPLPLKSWLKYLLVWYVTIDRIIWMLNSCCPRLSLHVQIIAGIWPLSKYSFGNLAMKRGFPILIISTLEPIFFNSFILNFFFSFISFQFWILKIIKFCI